MLYKVMYKLPHTTKAHGLWLPFLDLWIGVLGENLLLDKLDKDTEEPLVFTASNKKGSGFREQLHLLPDFSTLKV